MIEKISLNNIATYKKNVDIIPKKLNFIYGSNGSGKTTISNFLGGYEDSIDSSIKISSGEQEIISYNKKFVTKNFSNLSDVPGVFTLGEDSKGLQERLNYLSKVIIEKQDKIDKKLSAISVLDSEIKSERDSLNKGCWKKQQVIGEHFGQALVGYRNSKEKFANECISQYRLPIREDVDSLEKVKEKYDIAYSKETEVYKTYDSISIPDIEKKESNEILQKIITGSQDSPFGDVIDYLGNSDWIREGLAYADKNNNKCPFCQQDLHDSIKDELTSYFDELYQKDCKEVDTFTSQYISTFGDVSQFLKTINDSPIAIINYDKFQALNNEYDAIFKLNCEELKKKQQSYSVQIEIQSLIPTIEDINATLLNYNTKIESNNTIVMNQEKEKLVCQKMLWSYIVLELTPLLSGWDQSSKGKQSAKNNISKQIEELLEEQKEANLEIRTIESTVTSVAPTATEINSILSKFDFKGFELKENANKKGTYIIYREDGSEATNTLSEGEYNFITFLYFYHLIYGSHDKTGIFKNKIIVIDDPISSLDSNVLFIISTLVKNLINDCRKNQFGIEQVFVLTHNVYFHKEVTFLGGNKEYKKDEVYFGILKKNENISYITAYDKNPIQTTYELLWQDLKSETTSISTTFNTMRRILEYYFQILGGIDYEKCISEFDGSEKITCRALISCINDGSHFINDDFVIIFDESTLDSYKIIFKRIFETLGQIEHYNMMMQ
ncbi:AAA family ATPase [Listeria booriae]|uniref:AAA family ATPase n=1 Tax=Listeria booriae TaxID=1552123 RepID=UPI00162A9748|nr:AAA family ATPase [Listeria booriae]EKR8711455.1 AAA family ATPase [Listeria monocytogenes]ELQ0050887.1 AAA family ATPase [Listeria monocytogenes]ELQ0053998.1 AAA family ATPase [Listeria monocytogenes]MBC2315218.1 AAA family ATPase [Listeria booriae]HAA6491773.1 ATP-binding protein [Listeria monocytogenes]